MSDAQFEAFLSSCRLEEFQKAELRTTNNRLQCYRNWIFWIELNDGKTAQVALNNYLAVNSIFMTDELRQKFKAINHRRRAFRGPDLLTRTVCQSAFRGQCGLESGPAEPSCRGPG